MFKVILFFLIPVFFVVGFLLSREALNKIYNDLQVRQEIARNVVTEKTGCDETCQKQIAAEVSRAISTISGTVKDGAVSKIIESVAKPQTSYIPLDGSSSTQSTDWVDAEGVEVAFDLADDYSANAKVAWEASLRVANANGTVYARLFDKTHNIAVSGSEISVINKADYQRISSGNLNLWAGRNIYRVQIKSLNSSKVDYTGGKIRISY